MHQVWGRQIPKSIKALCMALGKDDIPRPLGHPGYSSGVLLPTVTHPQRIIELEGSSSTVVSYGTDPSWQRSSLCPWVWNCFPPWVWSWLPRGDPKICSCAPCPLRILPHSPLKVSLVLGLFTGALQISSDVYIMHEKQDGPHMVELEFIQGFLTPYLHAVLI